MERRDLLSFFLSKATRPGTNLCIKNGFWFIARTVWFQILNPSSAGIVKNANLTSPHLLIKLVVFKFTHYTLRITHNTLLKTFWCILHDFVRFFVYFVAVFLRCSEHCVHILCTFYENLWIFCDLHFFVCLCQFMYFVYSNVLKGIFRLL